MTQHGKNRAHEERMASYEKTMAVHIKAATSASEVVECLTKTVMKEFSHRHFDTYDILFYYYSRHKRHKAKHTQTLSLLFFMRLFNGVTMLFRTSNNK